MSGSSDRPLCRECGLWEGCRTPFMDGAGPMDSPVAIVGEAPAGKDDLRGVPFSGDAGALLSEILRDLPGLERPKVRVLNAIRCAPPGGRILRSHERGCFPLLLEELGEMPNLRLVVALGNTALLALTGKKGITSEHGQPREVELPGGRTITLIPAFHPSYVLREPGHLDAMVRDLTLAHRFLTEGAPERPAVSYRTLLGAEAWEEFWREAKDVVAYDFETRGLRPWASDFLVLGIALATAPGRAWFAPLDHPPAELTKREREEQVREIKKFLTSKVPKADHWGTFDVGVAEAVFKVTPQNVVLDTYLGYFAVDEEDCMQGGSLGALEWKLLPETAGGRKAAALDGDTESRSRLYEMDLGRLTSYACGDADSTLQLVPILRRELRRERIPNSLMQWELRRRATLSRMRRRGAVIDWEEQEAAVVRFSSALRECVEELRSYEAVRETERLLAGAGASDIFGENREPFNPRSPKHKKVLVYEVLGLPPDPEALTKSGQAVAEARGELLPEHYKLDLTHLDGYLSREDLPEETRGLVEALARFGRLRHLHDTYLSKLPEFRDPDTDRVHSDFGGVMHTWRSKSTNPNLQNLPRAGDGSLLGPAAVKRCYIAGPGWRLLQADYSQLELRMMALLSQDEEMLRAYLEDLDIHRLLAARAFGVAMEEVTKEQRQEGKTLNFSTAYKLPRYEGEGFEPRFWNTYKGYAAWVEETRRGIERTGKSRGLFGHVRRLPGAQSDDRKVRNAAIRAGCNFPVQNTASCLAAYAMTEVDEFLLREGFASYVFLSVYDSIVLRVREEELSEVAIVVKTIMENMPFPWLHGTPDYPQAPVMKADLEVGDRLSELEPYEVPA